jgi:hypothetical protein
MLAWLRPEPSGTPNVGESVGGCRAGSDDAVLFERGDLGG